jgi:hypothetical protein
MPLPVRQALIPMLTVLRERLTRWHPITDSFACVPRSPLAMVGSPHPNAYGDALWYGIFDAAYTRPGDYLAQTDGVWFIAAQQRLLPVLCVKTNRVVSFSRPSAPSGTGINKYGGTTATTSRPLLTSWPASVLGVAGRGRPSADLPADATVPHWVVLLPAIPDIVLLPSDLMIDDLGRNAVVASAELTELGWRLAITQATT